MSIASRITLACECAVAEGEMARPREFNEVTALEAAVECFWQHGYKATSVRDLARKGCFLVNSALEVAPHQSELGAVIAKQFADIEAFFKRCILAAQANGTAPRGVDATNTARLLLGALIRIGR
jgi:hypothetical protein